MAQWLIKECLVNKNTAGLWVDTTQPNIDDYYERYFARMLYPARSAYTWSQQKKLLRFVNGSYIDFGSAQSPENLEGFQYKRAVLNEAGIIFKKSGLWDNTLRPMFKGEDVQVKIIGTPKGKNKFHELYQMGRDPLEKDYESFHYSAYDSPYWDAKELGEIKRRTPQEAWEQEYLAQFIDGAGSVFRNVAACVHNDIYNSPREGVEYVMSVDLAKHQDFTVLAIGERNTGRMIYMERFNQIDWTLQKQRIINVWQRFNQPKLIIDSSGVGDAIYDDLRSAGLNIEGFKFTGTSKAELIRNLSVALDNNEIGVPNYPELLSELELYEYDVTKGGNVSYNAPDGFHDDCVIALALLNRLMKTYYEVNLTFI